MNRNRMPITTSNEIIDSELNSPSFRAAELRSELIRVRALLAVFGSLLVLILIRGVASRAHGYRDEAWPFAALLAVMTAYEVLWLKFARKAMDSGRAISFGTWAAGICVESLAPTAALFLEIWTPMITPDKVPVSPIILTYFLLIILSTLHLNPALSRLSGGVSAVGYAAASICVLGWFPEVVAADRPFLYG